MTDTLRLLRSEATPIATGPKLRRDDPRMGTRSIGLDADPRPDKVLAVIVGVADDRGVQLAGGRVGAADAPSKLRDFFFRLPAPPEFGPGSVLNAGDLKPAEHTAETHARLAEVVAVLRERFPRAKLVVVGGGHDHAFGEVMGLARSLQHQPASAAGEGRVGVLSIDAHADVRPYVEGPRNLEPPGGTALRRLIAEPTARVEGQSVAVWGLQRACNASSWLQFLDAQGAKAVYLDEIDGDDRRAGAQLTALLYELASRHDALSLSLDMDAFAQSVSPGVSVPSPVGVPPGAVLRGVAALGRLPCLHQLGIYGLNPRFDQDAATARLAARVAWGYVTGLF